MYISWDHASNARRIGLILSPKGMRAETDYKFIDAWGRPTGQAAGSGNEVSLSYTHQRRELMSSGFLQWTFQVDVIDDQAQGV